MANDRVAEFRIGIEGDDSQVTAVLARLKNSFGSTLATIESQASKLKLFDTLGDKVKAASDALTKAKDESAKLQEQLDEVTKSGGKASDELTKGAKDAAQAVKAATVEFDRQVAAITRTQSGLVRLGVDTKNVTAEQQRLADAYKQTTIAATNQAAQQLLGLRTLKDVTPEVQRLYAAYNTLSVSGTLSVKELSLAQQQLKDRVAELRGQVTGVGAAAKASEPDLTGFFTNTLAPALGLTLSLGTVVTLLQSAAAAGRELRQATAEIGATSNLTKDQLKALEDGARSLAERVGTDVVDSLKVLKEIIRSTSLGPEDALAVLAASADTAKGSISSLNVVARVSSDLISAYGISVAELPRVLDGLFASMKAGGPTFDDLNGKIGNLAVVGKAVGVPVSDLTALLNVMTSASGDAGGSIAALQRILVAFNTEATRAKLRELRIEATSFTDVMKELAAKGIPISQLIELGLTGTKTAVGVAALTRSSGDLTAAFQRQATAAGTGKKALIEYLESPQGRADQFNVAINETKVRISQLTGEGSKLGLIATYTAASFNQLLDDLGLTKPATDAAAQGFVGVADATKLAAEAASEYSKWVQENKQRTGELGESLGALATRILANAKALQDTASTDIAKINARADAEIAALDRSLAATGATAAATIAIQIRAADERLAIVRENERKVAELVEQAVKARQAAQQKGEEFEKKNAAEIAKIRLGSIAEQIKINSDLYASLNGQAQAHLARVENLEQQRVGIVRGIESDIFSIRLAGLSAFDQYLAKVKEVERLVSEARLASARGDIKTATDFTQEAVTLAKSLGPVYSANGALIVTQGQASQKAIDLIRVAKEQLIKAIDAEKEKEGQAASALQERMKDVSAQLVILQVRFNNLRLAVDEGFDIQVQLDRTAADAAIREINELTKDRTIRLIVKTIIEGATGQQVDVTGGVGGTGTFNRGGFVGAVQRFADGGNVFRSPTWSKVPGVGNEDTQPALLQSGSFVVRKAASAFAGDGIMSMLAQRFAVGGPAGIGGGPNASRGFTNDTTLAIAKALGLGENFGTDLHKIKVAAEAEIYAILSRATNLPRATFGQDVRDYLSRVLELIRNTSNVDEAKALLDRVVVYYNRFYPAIETARQFHVPLAMGSQIVADPNPKTKGGSGNAWQDLQNSPSGWDKLNPGSGGPFRFAAGGSVDSVPAMLTPGEYVIQPGAVQRIAQLMGGGFLPALNAMKVPRGFLDNLANFAPPPRPLAFATGGPVPGGPSYSVSGGAGGKGGPVTINIYAQRVDEAEVRRSILPVIDRLQRSKGKG